MLKEENLCNVPVAEKSEFQSYTVEYLAKPGYALCPKCVRKRAELLGEIPKKTIDEREKLVQWIENSKQFVGRKVSE